MCSFFFRFARKSTCVENSWQVVNQVWHMGNALFLSMILQFSNNKSWLKDQYKTRLKLMSSVSLQLRLSLTCNRNITPVSTQQILSISNLILSKTKPDHLHFIYHYWNEIDLNSRKIQLRVWDNKSVTNYTRHLMLNLAVRGMTC